MKHKVDCSCALVSRYIVVVGWVGWLAGMYDWQSVRYNCLKMHHICDLFENHIEREIEIKQNNKLKWNEEKTTAFSFVSGLFFTRYAWAYSHAYMNSSALDGNPKLCVCLLFLLKFRRILSSDAWHSLLLYYSIFVVMLLLFGITLLNDNGPFSTI